MMISSIISSSPNITVSNTSSNYVSESGPLHWNGSYQQIEVMTHNGYVPLTNGQQIANISSVTLDMVVNWAINQMTKETQLEALLKSHPGLRDAKEKYDIMLALVRKEESGDNQA